MPAKFRASLSGSRRRHRRQFNGLPQRAPSDNSVNNDKANADRWLTRFASAAQVGILGLGIFGYFYTVLPVFQNQRLQEELAKLQLNKENAQKQLSELLAKQRTVTQKTAALKEQLAQAHSQVAESLAQVHESTERERVAQQKAHRATAKLRNELQALDSARWKIVLASFRWAVFRRQFSEPIIGVTQADNYRDPSGTFLAQADAQWVTPFQLVSSALSTAEKNIKSQPKIPESYYRSLRQFVREHKSQLTCNKPDFETMQQDYRSDFQKIGLSTEKELQESIDKIEKEYAEKGQKILITDQFRAAKRRGIRVSKEVELESRYSKAAMASRTKCDEVINDFFIALRTAKNVTEN